MQLSFLSARNGLRLAKTFSQDKSTPYPHVTNVDSHHATVHTPQELFTALTDQASKGHCLMKGELKRHLENESRKGQSDRNAYSDLLVLDIDNLTLPQMPFGNGQLTKLHVEQIANTVVSARSQELHDVTYIAQASASFGLKPTYSLHIFFMLTVPLPPKTIKLWLQQMNHSTELFNSQCSLSVNGQSLKYPLDISVADNSKLIFIAPPTFINGAVNPFEDDDNRTTLVVRGQETLDLASLMDGISPENCFAASKRRKDELRKDAGMGRKAEKITRTQVNFRMEEILTNPDQMNISVYNDTNYPFVHCDINGGDSHAYYFLADNPTYMHNFKGEPIFEIEKADPDFYLSIFE